MNIIKSIHIKNLWGKKSIDIDINEKVNFIIGVNGTGKTTLINLLAAVLTLDIEKLLRIEFDSIEIKMESTSNSKKPSIKLLKEYQSPQSELIYEIKHFASGIAKKFTLENIYFDYEDVPQFARRRNHPSIRRTISELTDILQDLFKISWLSVNRMDELVKRDRNSLSRREIDKMHFLSIDYKIDDLSLELTKYFSLLSQKFTEQTIEFQKKSFLALINYENTDPIFAFSKSINIEDEKQTLIEVFKVLGVDEKHYIKKLDSHFKLLSNINEKSKNNNQRGISVNDFSVMYNSWRAHTLVADYEVLQTKRKQIFEPVTNFINLLNDLFDGRKIFSVSEKNELVIETKDGRTIQLLDLSSGEKQLLIILGEALLQCSKSFIFIADEPELSLHVIWQEQLVNAITILNPNVQIIFATHSPDIVGINQNAVIDMEKLTS